MGYHKSELYFEEIGEQFNAWMSSYDVQQRIKLINDLLPASSSEMSCLEIGCGNGAISEALEPVVSCLTVSDTSETLAKGVGERLGVDWGKQDACNLAIPETHLTLSSPPNVSSILQILGGHSPRWRGWSTREGF